MSYYFSKTLKSSFDETIELATKALQKEGFGVLTEINVTATLKKKLDVDFKPYHILGACHPPSAHKALTAEDKIGLMLPYNVIVVQQEDGVEVSAIDPMASMQSVENDSLGPVAIAVQKNVKACN